MDGKAFLRELDEIKESYLAARETAERNVFQDAPMTLEEAIPRVQVSCWTELWSVPVLASWIQDLPDVDLQIGLAKQVWDEACHYRMLRKWLTDRGASIEGFEPPEAHRSVYRYIESLPTWGERMAAHNYASEAVALGVQIQLSQRGDDDLRRIYEQIIVDEHFHFALGCRAVEKYATTPERQARAREAVRAVFEMREAARSAIAELVT